MQFEVLDVTPSTKVLLAYESGGVCPKCCCGLLEGAIGCSSPANAGQCAHIRGEKPGAARFDSTMTAEERRAFDNLLYLCARCHTIVDAQREHYTVEVLAEMKRAQQEGMLARTRAALPKVQFAELRIVCDMVASVAIPASEVSPSTPVPAKMAKNGIESPGVQTLIGMAVAKASVVAAFVQMISQVDASYPERLRNGFLTELARLQALDLSGDAAFIELYKFAAGHSDDFVKQAAGLAVLGYFFEACEVFQP